MDQSPDATHACERGISDQWTHESRARATQALLDHTQITVCTLHPTLREAKQRQTQGPRGRNAYIFSRVTRSGASPFQQHLQWLSKLARRPS